MVDSSAFDKDTGTYNGGHQVAPHSGLYQDDGKKYANNPVPQHDRAGIILHDTSKPVPELHQELLDKVEQATSAKHQHIMSQPSPPSKGPGTTLLLNTMTPEAKLHTTHVGDSPGFLALYDKKGNFTGARMLNRLHHGDDPEKLNELRHNLGRNGNSSLQKLRAGSPEDYINEVDLADHFAKGGQATMISGSDGLLDHVKLFGVEDRIFGEVAQQQGLDGAEHYKQAWTRREAATDALEKELQHIIKMKGLNEADNPLAGMRGTSFPGATRYKAIGGSASILKGKLLIEETNPAWQNFKEAREAFDMEKEALAKELSEKNPTYQNALWQEIDRQYQETAQIYGAVLEPLIKKDAAPEEMAKALVEKSKELVGGAKADKDNTTAVVSHFKEVPKQNVTHALLDGNGPDGCHVSASGLDAAEQHLGAERTQEMFLNPPVKRDTEVAETESPTTPVEQLPPESKPESLENHDTSTTTQAKPDGTPAPEKPAPKPSPVAENEVKEGFLKHLFKDGEELRKGRVTAAILGAVALGSLGYWALRQKKEESNLQQDQASSDVGTGRSA